MDIENSQNIYLKTVIKILKNNHEYKNCIVYVEKDIHGEVRNNYLYIKKQFKLPNGFQIQETWTQERINNERK